jgi:hypothetical protein
LGPMEIRSLERIVLYTATFYPRLIILVALVLTRMHRRLNILTSEDGNSFRFQNTVPCCAWNCTVAERDTKYRVLYSGGT